MRGIKAPDGWTASTRLRLHHLPDEKIPAFLEADQMAGDPDSNLTLTGNAQVRRIDGIVKGDRIDYSRETGDVVVTGSARMLRDATLVTGPSARVNVDTGSGEIEQPNFWIGATGGKARADHADIFSRSQMRLTNVTYSGCPCAKPSWYITADVLDIDMDENEGVAKNGVLYFKGVPILAAPYLTFPVKKERKSGFLAPIYGTSSRTGFDLTAPYYFNLAPNYDLTLSPRYMSKRGPLLGAEGRYLDANSHGTIQGAYLSDDLETGNSRWLYRWRNYSKLGNGFYTDWDLAGVSDDDYFRDITSVGLDQASTTHLPKRARFGWANSYWQTSVQVYKYQTLQDPEAPLRPPFDKLPELKLEGQRYDWGGFDADWASSVVRFRRPVFFGQRLGAEGNRLQTYPTVSYPIVRPGWFITPKVGVNYTQYDTNWYGTDWNGLGSTAGYQRNQSRTVPIASLDAGMVFERQTTLFDRSATQTLEPRLYYLRVPYRNQNNLPVYDTTLGNFSFDQAFQENTYVGGWDRIANANQVTAALTTRWIDSDTGIERLSLSAGQRMYFEDQLVTLPGEQPRKNVRSDYLAAASAALTDTLGTEVGAQYNPYDSQWSRVYATARWAPQRLTSVSLTYRYQREPLPDVPYQPAGQNQVSLTVQWPFTSRWYGVGRVDYSVGTQNNSVSSAVRGSRVTQAIAGLEYRGDCCWVARTFFQRYAVSAAQENTAIFFQLELLGLGSIGSDPMSLIHRSLPGYEPVTPPPTSGTTFERYE
jgi:LPS-assembly protein